MTLKRYPEYQNADRPWLGDFPAHWKLIRIKRLLHELDDRTECGEEPLLSMRQHRGLVLHNDVSNKKFNAPDLIGYKRTRPGELVMNRMRASIGLFASTEKFGLVSPDYAVFRVESEVTVDYLVHLFQTAAMGEKFRVESKGLGTGSAGFLRLYTDRFGAIPITIPPRREQEFIVAYIEKSGKHFQRLLRQKRKLVKLLNEQKLVIIHRAVTRGLDPSARLKPSGFDWLGDVPQH